MKKKEKKVMIISFCIALVLVISAIIYRNSTTTKVTVVKTRTVSNIGMNDEREIVCKTEDGKLISFFISNTGDSYFYYYNGKEMRLPNEMIEEK